MATSLVRYKSNSFVRTVFGLVILLGLTLASGLTKAEMLIRVSPSDFRTTPIDGNYPPTVTTLSRAVELAESFRRSDPAQSIVIELSGGTYRSQTPIVLDGRRLNSEHGRLVIRSAPGEKVRFTGTASLPEPLPDSQRYLLPGVSQKAAEHLLYFKLEPKDFASFGNDTERGQQYPSTSAPIEFFQDGQPLSIARWPSVGYASLRLSERPVGMSNSGEVFQLSDFPKFDLSGPRVWSVGFPSKPWRYERQQVISNIGDTLQIQRNDVRYPLTAGSRMALEGSPAFLNKPGSYAFDPKTGVLAVWPLPMSDPASFEATVAPSLVSVNNMQHLRIEGIQFDGARGDVISIRESEDVVITDCLVSNSGNVAVRIDGGQSVNVRRSVIMNAGQEAVWLVAGDRKTLKPGRNAVNANVIANAGRLNLSARAAIWLDGVGNRITDNLFDYHPAGVIRFSGNDHLIKGNEIEHAMRDCGDCGAIYTGFDWTARGTLIEENLIHDSPSGPELETKGIYLDDLASGITARKNVLLAVTKAFLIGGGRDNIVSENVVVGATEYGVMIDGRGAGWMSHQVDDPNSILQRRLRAVPYRSLLYAMRYPHLATILDDEPNLPKYNVVSKMKFVDSRGVVIDSRLNDARLLAPINSSPSSNTKYETIVANTLQDEKVRNAIQQLQIPLQDMMQVDRLSSMKYWNSYTSSTFSSEFR